MSVKEESAQLWEMDVKAEHQRIDAFKLWC